MSFLEKAGAETPAKIAEHPHGPSLSAIAKALEKYWEARDLQTKALSCKEYDEGVFHGAINHSLEALEFVEEAIFDWNAKNPIPERRLSFFRELDLMENLLCAIDQARGELADTLERFELPVLTETGENEQKVNELWRTQCADLLIKGDWSHGSGAQLRSLVNGMVLRLLRSPLGQTLPLKLIDDKHPHKPLLYLITSDEKLEEARGPEDILLQEGFRQNKVIGTRFPRRLMEHGTYLPISGMANPKGPHLAFHTPITHLANVFELMSNHFTILDMMAQEHTLALRNSWSMARIKGYRFVTRKPEEYVFVTPDAGDLVASLDPPDPRYFLPKRQDSETASPTPTDETDAPAGATLEDKIAGLTACRPVLGMGSQTSVFELTGTGGEKLYLKVLREGSLSPSPEREIFASRMLETMDSPKVRSQKAYRLERNSVAFAQLIQFAQTLHDKSLRNSLDTFRSTSIKALVIFEAAMGTCLGAISPQEAKSIKFGEDDSYNLALGELAFYDLMLGNNDRILRSINLDNIFYDFKDKTLHPVDHNSDFTWMYSYIIDLHRVMNPKAERVSSSELREMLRKPWKHARKLERIKSETIHLFRDIMAQGLDNWLDSDTSLPFTTFHKSSHNQMFNDYRPLGNHELGLFESGFLQGALNFHQKKGAIRAMLGTPSQELALEFATLREICEAFFEIMNPRAGRIQEKLAGSQEV
ncbi:hypothetical protein [Fulvitalea axinellae]